MRIWQQQNEASSNRNKSKSIHSCSNEYRNQKASDSVKVQNERNSTQNLTPQWKKLILRNYAFVFTNTMKKKEMCIQFPSFLSQQDLSTRFKTSIHLRETKFIPVFVGQKYISSTSRATNERMQNWGPSLTLKKTTTALNLVEHLKRVDIEKRTWKRNKWFSEVINKPFHHQMKQKQTWRCLNKGIKIRLHWRS